MKLAARAIITNDDSVLLVRHKNRDFFALPGGKINSNEDVRTGLVREIYEELGTQAEIGPLLYVHEFRYPGGDLSLEFFFRIENPQDFNDNHKGELADVELAEIRWIPFSENFLVKPPFLKDMFPSASQRKNAEFISACPISFSFPKTA
ncbi:NUDIX domain-containing protein [Candidatus Peregrinibacteria bacterium]|nr:MAG: NUDIX domain-containing protein [Candidatus Peregrinibacteria bacterium]